MQKNSMCVDGWVAKVTIVPKQHSISYHVHLMIIRLLLFRNRGKARKAVDKPACTGPWDCSQACVGSKKQQLVL